MQAPAQALPEDAIFLSHNGMSEPLGQTQVLPYLRGLVEGGVRIELLACEPPGTPKETAARLKQTLAASGIAYTALMRRPSHALSDKVRDGAALGAAAVRVALRRRRAPRVLHARSQLPSAVAELLAALSPRTRFIFDCRGLLAQEYVDMGHWLRGELRYRLTEAAEAYLMQRADRVVVLTEAMREDLCGPGGPLRHREGDVVVIPCCVDPERFRPDPEARRRRRAELGLDPDESQPVLCFAGSQARYDLEAAARLVAAMRRRSDARFLLLSRADPARVRAAMAALGCEGALHAVAAAPKDVPGWLCAADFGVALLRDCRSSIATSPTKVAECLAVGLPTVVSEGVADASYLRGPGLLPVNPADRRALAALADELLDDWRGPSSSSQARATALRHFSLPDVGVPRYRALYAGLA
jgi:glycosyltransferase involved in cell wall biosynthesis